MTFDQFMALVSVAIGLTGALLIGVAMLQAGKGVRR
jgi:hypothetical protein